MLFCIKMVPLQTFSFMLNLFQFHVSQQIYIYHSGAHATCPRPFLPLSFFFIQVPSLSFSLYIFISTCLMFFFVKRYDFLRVVFDYVLVIQLQIVDVKVMSSKPCFFFLCEKVLFSFLFFSFSFFLGKRLWCAL